MSYFQKIESRTTKGSQGWVGVSEGVDIYVKPKSKQKRENGIRELKEIYRIYQVICERGSLILCKILFCYTRQIDSRPVSEDLSSRTRRSEVRVGCRVGQPSRYHGDKVS